MTTVKAWLIERQQSYSRDAQRFSDAATDGPPILGGDYDAHWAAIYGAIAQELDKLTREIPGSELACICCIDNECECEGRKLS
jgi:hypothetical protein